jgi:hypothetical protein
MSLKILNLSLNACEMQPLKSCLLYILRGAQWQILFPFLMVHMTYITFQISTLEIYLSASSVMDANRYFGTMDII